MSTESCLLKGSVRLAVYCVVISWNLVLGWAASAYSEQRIINGVSFNVEELRPTGAGSTAVVLGRESALVDDEKINDYIVEQYFKNRELFLTLSTKQVEQFVSAALEEGDIEAGALAVRGLFEFGDASNPSVVTYFEELKKNERGVELFKRLLPDMPAATVSPQIFSILIVTVAVQDLNWIHDNIPTVLKTHSAELRSYLQSRVYEHIKDQDLDSARPLADLMTALFSPEDEEVKSLKLLMAKLQSLLSGSLKEGNEAVISLSELAGDDPVLHRYLAPVFIDTIHQRSVAALNGRNSERALILLSFFFIDRGTTEIYTLLIEALRVLPQQSEVLLQRKKIEDFIVYVAEKDSFVREAYIENLEQNIAYRVSKGLLSDTRSVFALLNRVRPDPNSLNDGLRIRSAITLIKLDQGAEADELLGDVKTGVPILDTLKIFFIKLFNSSIFTVFLVAAFLALAAFFWRTLIKLSDPSSPRRRAQPEVDGPQDSERPAFVTARSRSGGLPHEYIECLHEFGMTPSSPMKEIKTAFRNRVKDIHPDHQSSANESPAEFIRIKAVYERLLEIRKLMGLD